MADYLRDFPFPENQMPGLLHSLLSTVSSLEPNLMIETTRRSEQKDGNKEYCHMVMATVPETALSSLQVWGNASSGVVAHSVPCCDVKGGLAGVTYSIAGYDYLVSSWGDGGFYTYNLSDKVWMTLGLSQRCIGNGDQKVVYDDLGEPVMNVAEGRVSNEFYWEQSRDVFWSIRNDYLRKYLWMRGHAGVRTFFYQSMIADTLEIRSLMAGSKHFSSEPKKGWYKIDIREHLGGLLLQVWATVVAVLPEKCAEPDIYSLIWPGDSTPMSEARANQYPRGADTPYIFLKDSFLQKYEENSLYDSVPSINPDGICYCSPSYKGQWGFTGLKRLGRNLIKVTPYDLFKGVPDKEILHAYKHAISPEEATSFDKNQEHIVQKTARFVSEFLGLGDTFYSLATNLGLPSRPPEEYIGLSRDELDYHGWIKCPIICKLCSVASLDMSEARFSI